jgi:hypothetical protein
MFNIFGFLSSHVMLLLGVALASLLGWQKYEIVTLEDEVRGLQLELSKEETKALALSNSLDGCKTGLERQNEIIESQKIEMTDREAKLKALKSLPLKVRYETVYKAIPSIELKSNECDDVKKVLREIRESGL